jgi:hypothetical protein
VAEIARTLIYRMMCSAPTMCVHTVFGRIGCVGCRWRNWTDGSCTALIVHSDTVPTLQPTAFPAASIRLSEDR